jgi:hypothetical protein
VLSCVSCVQFAARPRIFVPQRAPTFRPIRFLDRICAARATAIGPKIDDRSAKSLANCRDPFARGKVCGAGGRGRSARQGDLRSETGAGSGDPRTTRGRAQARGDPRTTCQVRGRRSGVWRRGFARATAGRDAQKVINLERQRVLPRAYFSRDVVSLGRPSALVFARVTGVPYERCKTPDYCAMAASATASAGSAWARAERAKAGGLLPQRCGVGHRLELRPGETRAQRAQLG